MNDAGLHKNRDDFLDVLTVVRTYKCFLILPVCTFSHDSAHELYYGGLRLQRHLTDFHGQQRNSE